jgi:hypothetical protein
MSSFRPALTALVRYAPATEANVPITTTAGDFVILGTSAFPTGTNVVYTSPSSFVAGPVAGATDATTAMLTGAGGSIYTTDVSGPVTAALNANAAGLSWILASNNEGPLPKALTLSGDFECRTSYDFDLQITHLY